ncbi:hypothetical protein [Pseudonocardia adelaidensis]|uniref:Uncharacterized protein n=1 Tax=Pseudonocardia adelaidensis TaxID=648754 RepID=A0ABP9NKQ4_9PSEU
MSLTNVWVQTHSDGLVRADQIIGIEAHPTAGVRDTPSHWLLDVVVAVPVGSGYREGWNVTALHRTLTQTAAAPQGASVALARLLAQLDVIGTAGVVHIEKASAGGSDADALSSSSGGVRFRFEPFRGPVAGDRTDAEYL